MHSAVTAVAPGVPPKLDTYTLGARRRKNVVDGSESYSSEWTCVGSTQGRLAEANGGDVLHSAVTAVAPGVRPSADTYTPWGEELPK